MGSMIGYFVVILLAAGSVLAAVLFFRHRQKQVMDGRWRRGSRQSRQGTAHSDGSASGRVR